MKNDQQWADEIFTRIGQTIHRSEFVYACRKIQTDVLRWAAHCADQIPDSPILADELRRSANQIEGHATTIVPSCPQSQKCDP